MRLEACSYVICTVLVLMSAEAFAQNECSNPAITPSTGQIVPLTYAVDSAGVRHQNTCLDTGQTPPTLLIPYGTIGYGTYTNLNVLGTVTTVNLSVTGTCTGCSASSAPIFSTPQTGVSMLGSTGNIGSAVTMTTPGSDGTYLITGQIIQTTPGSTGICTTGTISVYLYYRDADTGVIYAAASYISFQSVIGANAVLSTLQMISAVNGAGNNFVVVPHYFRAKAGTAIQYQLNQATLSNCTIPPVFTVRLALFGPLGY